MSDPGAGTRIADEDFAVAIDLGPSRAVRQLRRQSGTEAIEPIQVQTGKNDSLNALIAIQNRVAEANYRFVRRAAGAQIADSEIASSDDAGKKLEFAGVDCAFPGTGGGQGLAIGLDDAEVGEMPVAGKLPFEEISATALAARADGGGDGQREEQLASLADDLFLFAGRDLGQPARTLLPIGNLLTTIFGGCVQS